MANYQHNTAVGQKSKDKLDARFLKKLGEMTVGVPFPIHDCSFEELMSLKGRNPAVDVICEIADKLMSDMNAEEARRQSWRRKVTLCDITDDYCEYLRVSYLMFQINVNPAYVQKKAKSYCIRKMDRHKVLSCIRDCDVRDKHCSTIIDFGGNFSDHLCAGIPNIHCCQPFMDQNCLDKQIRRCENMNPKYTTTQKQKALEEIKAVYDDKFPSCSYYCKRKCEDCDFEGDWMMAIHSTYDVAPVTFAKAMEKHGASIAYVAMHFDVRMFLADSGEIEVLDMRWEKSEYTNLYGQQVKGISFTFENDFANCERYDWDVYSSWFIMVGITTDQSIMVTEIFETMPHSIILKTCLIPKSTHALNQKGIFRYDCILFRCLWLNYKFENVMVKIFDYDTKNTKEILKLRWVIIDKETLSLIKYYTRSGEKSLDEVFCDAKSVASKFVANNRIKESKVAIDPQDLGKVCFLALLHARKEMFMSSQADGRFLQVNQEAVPSNIDLLTAMSQWICTQTSKEFGWLLEFLNCANNDLRDEKLKALTQFTFEEKGVDFEIYFESYMNHSAMSATETTPTLDTPVKRQQRTRPIAYWVGETVDTFYRTIQGMGPSFTTLPAPVGTRGHVIPPTDKEIIKETY